MTRISAPTMLVVMLLFAAFPSNGMAKAKNITLATSLSNEKLRGVLLKPKGKGPFPAIVLLHGCSGVLKKHYKWARRFIRFGYVALIVDSFRSRGLPRGVCHLPWKKWVSRYWRRLDAYVGLKYLSDRKYVKKNKIVVVGWSNGGGAVLSAANAQDAASNVKLAGNSFSAAIAVYPNCGVNYGNWSIVRSHPKGGPIVHATGRYEAMVPLLILIGEKDDWTTARHCRLMLKMANDPKIKLIVYPNAHHAFDSGRQILLHEASKKY